MNYLLMLHFNLTLAVIPFATIEECKKESAYYRQHYGEELSKSECVRIDEDLLDDN